MHLSAECVLHSSASVFADHGGADVHEIVKAVNIAYGH